MVKRDMSERKLILDTKGIASKKRSEEFLVQEVSIFKNNTTVLSVKFILFT